MHSQKYGNYIAQGQQYDQKMIKRQKSIKKIKQQKQTQISIRQQRKKKAIEFHTSIVKQKKMKILRSTRHINQLKFEQKQMNVKVQQLNTQIKYLEFLKYKSQQLKGQPNRSWFKIINQILWCMKIFKKYNHKNEWIKNGILEQLFKIFKKKYINLNLAPLAAKILSKLFYIEPSLIKQTEHFSSLKNIIHYTVDQSLSNNSIGNFIQLMGTILLRYPQQFMQLWSWEVGLKYSIIWLNRIIESNIFEQNHVNKIYIYIQYLIQYLIQNNQKIKVKTKWIRNLFKTLNQIIEFEQQTQNTENIFKIISLLFDWNIINDKSSDSPNQIIRYFFQYQRLQQKIIKTLSVDLQNITILILNIMKNHCLKCSTKIEEFQDIGMIKDIKQQNVSQKRILNLVILKIVLIILKKLIIQYKTEESKITALISISDTFRTILNNNFLFDNQQIVI